MTLSRSTMSGLALWTLFQISGCSHTYPIDLAGRLGERSLYVEGVPFYPQKEYQCGPASLAAVLNYFGQAVSPEEIAEAI
ncbi:MAG TPA: C39 family peptidase, partial [Nitrospiria bacterium]|nr:C39 family peptidase [Nitrospiria bacterium]